MEAEDVLQLPWKQVTDWSGLKVTFQCGRFTICEDDVETFVYFIFSDIARILRIPYDQLYPVLQEENQRFYSLKKEIFENIYVKKHGIYSESNYVRLLKMQNALMVPDIDVITGNRIDRCVSLFKELSDAEKAEFLDKIGRIKVKIEYCE